MWAIAVVECESCVIVGWCGVEMHLTEEIPQRMFRISSANLVCQERSVAGCHVGVRNRR